MITHVYEFFEGLTAAGKKTAPCGNTERLSSLNDLPGYAW